jgi:nucleoside-diphosphate-sugar epimerase
MKILITGATGFVGRTLIPYLFSRSRIRFKISSI